MRVWAVCVVVMASIIGAVMGAAGPALADHLDVEASVPDDVRVGDVVEIHVLVRSVETGERVQGAAVKAFRDASIAGVSGEVELASATTDGFGEATLRWPQHAGSSHALTVEVSPPGEAEFETVTLSVVTLGSGPQVVRSESGVRIPGLGAWVLIAVLVSVWALIQFALLGPMTVAREGAQAHEEEEKQDEVTAASGSG